MPIPKPTAKMSWGVGNPDFANRVVEPSTAKKQAAWLDDERPPAPIMNWLFWIVQQWLDYFENVSDEFETRYDAIIGAGAAATHATLQDAVNDVSLGADVWVRVDDAATIDSAINLNKARWRIDFKSTAVYTKGAGAPANCLQMAAEGIIVNYGRFVGWTGGGDAAIKQTVDGEYCSVFGSRFGPGTTTEVDQSAVPAGKIGPVTATISEV